MNRILLFVTLAFLTFSIAPQAIAQRAKPSPAKRRTVVKSPVEPAADPVSEKNELEKALAQATPAAKIDALEKFLKRYPAAVEKLRAQESLTGARAAYADERFEAGDNAAASAIFQKALADAPRPFSERFFAEVIVRIPANLYFRGDRRGAIAAAASIEKDIAANPAQLVRLANFFLSIEGADEAKRIADAAIKLDSAHIPAYLVRANAERMNFDLQSAAKTYGDALAIDPTSIAAKRGLAEMHRAAGRANDAVDLFREVLDNTAGDHQARTGVILALFDAGKRQEAETEMAKAIELGAGNVVLVAGAAYWYATQNEAARAVELARQAVASEPRYIWGHIALARGLMAQQKPLEAEQVLVNARKFGNFPTLEYEIAVARTQSGFFREAADELLKSFSVNGDWIETRLGGRVARKEKTFATLVAHERLASIFQPSSPDGPETVERLRSLLNFRQKLEDPSTDDDGIASAADAFVAGEDRMKIHRQIYAAEAIAQKNRALAKAIELAKAATGKTDVGLEVLNPSAAVMASELYESRSLAFARGEFIIVPEVPRPTLSAIMRGRVEEIAGTALAAQGSQADAIVRFRRAVSVYPDKSAWWRSAMWRLGAALEASGKDTEALDAYIKTYKIDKPDVVRYGVIENLYRKVNGNTEGLESQIGANPLPKSSPITTVETVAAAAPTPAQAEVAEVKPTSTPVIVAEVKATPAPVEVAEVKPTPVEAATAIPVATPTAEIAEVKPTPTPAVAETRPTPAPTPVTETAAAPEISAQTAETSPQAESVAVADAKPAETRASEDARRLDSGAKAATPSVEVKITENLSAATSSSAASVPSPTPKPLFEPIIITIPAAETPKRSEPESKNEPAVENAAEGTPKCTLKLSDDSVSIVKGGGSIGVLAELTGTDIADDLTFVSSSPENVEVHRDPSDATTGARRFFIIKSLTGETGLYTVEFASRCGKAAVSVRVR